VKLYTYFRSSAAYRVRMALNYKSIPYEMEPVHLVRDGGQHKTPAYRAVNPQMRVPSLELDDGTVIVQSPAILEYLEEVHPEPALLPVDPAARAKVRAVAAVIGCDIHPLNNLCVLNYLKGELGNDQDTVNRWYDHWITEGFAAVEALIAPNGASSGRFACGDTPSLADVYIVPQVFNARRFNVPLDAYPTIQAVDAACAEIPAFADAAPGNQPDAE